MKLEPLKDLLVAGAHGVFGTSIFIGMMPADARLATMLRQPANGIPYQHDLPRYFKGRLSLITRAENYQDAEARMLNAISLLTVANRQLAGYYINYLRPYSQPVSYPLTDAGLVEWNCTMEICFVEDAGG